MYIEGALLAIGGKAWLIFEWQGMVNCDLNAESCTGTSADVSRDCDSQGVIMIVGIEAWDPGITTGVFWRFQKG
jgi:hypothetical protein